MNNFYSLIALLLAIIVFAYVFGVIEAVGQFVCATATMPLLEEFSDDPFQKLAIKMAYVAFVVMVLIAILRARA